MHHPLPFGFTSVLLSLLWTRSWNIRCDGSHMKSCLWTEKAKAVWRQMSLLVPSTSRREKTNLVYFYLTKAMSRHPKCFITLPRLEGLELFPVPSLGVGCASELTITTDKNTDCNQDMCHGCLLFRDEMADWKTHWQWSLWCFSCILICYEGRVSIYYRFGECWHGSRGFDVDRCQRFRSTVMQS